MGEVPLHTRFSQLGVSGRCVEHLILRFRELEPVNDWEGCGLTGKHRGF